MLGLRFRARALSICGKWGPLFIAVRGPLTVAVKDFFLKYICDMFYISSDDREGKDLPE